MMTVQKVAFELLSNYDGKTISWPQIMNMITSSGVKVKNWMIVRNELQKLIDRKKFVRTSDLNVEEYTVN